MKLTTILALVAGSLAKALPSPFAEPNDLVERKIRNVPLERSPS